MALLQEDFRRDTSILSVQRKACFTSLTYSSSCSSRVLSGWTPSTFTSSRAERAKAKKAKPEDFMDEEDLAEMRESRKLVDTNDQMDVDIWSSEGRKGDTGGEDE